MDDVELPIGGLLVLLPATRPAKGYYQVVERRDRADLSQMSPPGSEVFTDDWGLITYYLLII